MSKVILEKKFKKGKELSNYLNIRPSDFKNLSGQFKLCFERADAFRIQFSLKEAQEFQEMFCVKESNIHRN